MHDPDELPAPPPGSACFAPWLSSRRDPPGRAPAGRLADKDTGVHRKPLGKLAERRDCHGELAPLDSAHVGAVQPAAVSESLLG